MGGRGSSKGTSSQITSWVEKNFKKVTVGFGHLLRPDAEGEQLTEQLT